MPVVSIYTSDFILSILKNLGKLQIKRLKIGRLKNSSNIRYIMKFREVVE
jgi:hypothetical protein